MSNQQVTDFEQHQLGMLLWQAHIHEQDGRKQEASEIREWVDHFVAQQERNGTGLVQGDLVEP